MNTHRFTMIAGVAAISNAAIATDQISDNQSELKADFADAHALTQDIRESLSLPLNQIINHMKSDFSFLRRFYNDPEATLAGYDLTADEQAALLTNDVKDLIRLGIARDEALIIASGTHRGGNHRFA